MYFSGLILAGDPGGSKPCYGVNIEDELHGLLTIDRVA